MLLRDFEVVRDYLIILLQHCLQNRNKEKTRKRVLTLQDSVMDTIGKNPVFSLGGSQHMHKIAYERKNSLDTRSCVLSDV